MCVWDIPHLKDIKCEIEVYRTSCDLAYHYILYRKCVKLFKFCPYCGKPLEVKR